MGLTNVTLFHLAPRRTNPIFTPYKGFVDFYLKEGETEREAIARTLRQTSFKDGISANEIVILGD